MMREKDKKELHKRLSAAIDQVLQDAETIESMPWIGEMAADLMAHAAMAVMLGIDDAQEYLRDNDMLVEQ